MPKISVIVPVYNTEKYLHRCVDSILAQTFTDFELILVDDGSIDRSGGICDDYAKRDSRIKVIHSSNKGVAAARNAALEAAAGKYVMFCDSDDYVADRWIEVLYKHAEAFPDSLVNCQFVKFNCENGKKSAWVIYGIDGPAHIPLSEYFYLYKFQYVFQVWNRIYRTDVISENGLRFDEDVSQGEDVLFNIAYMKYCGDFFYVPEPLYYWTDNSVLTLSRKYEPRYFEVLRAMYFPRKSVTSDKYIQEFYDEFFFRFFNCIEVVNDERNTAGKREKMKYCSRILRDNAFADALDHASEAACNKKLKRILKLKSYRILALFERLTQKKKPRR